MFVSIIEFCGYLAIFLISLVIHEIVHARLAFYLGDSTAKDMGRFSFNPLKHLTLTGVLIPITLYWLGGPMFSFAKPVPCNHINFKNPKRDMIIVGLAAPFANFILALMALLLYNKLTMLPETACLYFNKFCTTAFRINFLLFTFNLLPIPPLDGSVLYMSTIVHKNSKLAQKISDYGLGILFFLLILAPLLGEYFGKNYNFFGMYIIPIA